MCTCHMLGQYVKCGEINVDVVLWYVVMNMCIFVVFCVVEPHMEGIKIGGTCDGRANFRR
jgi:hypothetical protein